MGVGHGVIAATVLPGGCATVVVPRDTVHASLPWLLLGRDLLDHPYLHSVG